MTWTCVKCGSTNSSGEERCSSCGLRLPSFPLTEVTENFAAEEAFRSPQKGDLTALLQQGIEQLRAGYLSLQEFQRRIESALENVPLVFSAILDEIQDCAEEASAYGHEVSVSLLDCQALFEAGLAELLHFTEDEDDFHLRFGWLLLEKAEQEYREIFKTLRRDSGNQAFEGADNVIGRLFQSLKSGELNQKDYQDQLVRFEQVSLDTIESIGALLSQAVEIASPGNQEDFSRASAKLSEASQRMGKLLLNLYAVEENASVD